MICNISQEKLVEFKFKGIVFHECSTEWIFFFYFNVRKQWYDFKSFNQPFVLQVSSGPVWPLWLS